MAQSASFGLILSAWSTTGLEPHPSFFKEVKEFYIEGFEMIPYLLIVGSN